MPLKNQTIKTVFIDRDGVINHDSPDYIKSCDEFRFISGSREAFRLLNTNGLPAIIITNQSAVGRNMISREGLQAIFSKMKTGIEASGGAIRDIFFCPHHPDDKCECRKPKPGMILNAAQKYTIDLSSSCMIGDSVKDILCAKNAGCRLSILVRTGNGLSAEKELAGTRIEPDHIADNLLDAVTWIIGKDTLT